MGVDTGLEWCYKRIMPNTVDAITMTAEQIQDAYDRASDAGDRRLIHDCATALRHVGSVGGCPTSAWAARRRVAAAVNAAAAEARELDRDALRAEINAGTR